MTDRSFGAEESATTQSATSDASSGATIADLRRELAEAAPRLEAFARLESLAEAQRQTPEALAIQASLGLLIAEEVERRAALGELRAEHQRQVEECDVLAKQRDELRNDVVIVLDEHTAIVDQLAEMIDELESIRADAVRLLGEKATLEMKIEALRNEVSALGGEVARRGELDTVLGDDEDEASAFDKFFEAEVVQDKARAWMLE